MQIIFHIDLNAFYVNAEISRNPKLDGKPLVVSRNSRRSIVTTASYEARAYGINSAMPLYQAKQKCPSLIVVEPHFDLYRQLSNEFFDIVSEYTSVFEVASIDECYCDMTDYITSHEKTPQQLAQELIKKVYDTLHLKTSIGIAPNKFLAKMGSDMKKPLGITTITNSNYKEVLWPVKIEDMFGVGKKTAPKLKKLGINTIGDLAKKENYDLIRPILGKNALVYYNRANGKDFSKINVVHNKLKSIGHSTTFEEDSNDADFIKDKLKALSLEVSSRAIKHDMLSNCLTITIKYTRDKAITRQMIHDHYFNDFETIYSLALLLFEKNYHGEYVRLVGVSLTNVIDRKEYTKQLSIFEEEEDIEEDEIDTMIKKFNEEGKGQFELTKASSLLNKNQSKYLKDD